MARSELNVVTGALSYSGRYITRRLLMRGNRILTLTGHPDRPRLSGESIAVAPFNFEKPAELARSLQGATTLYNTYWVRFAYGSASHQQAVENSRILFQAAQEAGIRRVVHISIANPSLDSPLPYYKGKAEVEQTLVESGLSYAILRPTVLFGGETFAEDVLINNIAWLLRHFLLFAIPGDGRYGIQPIHVEDLAELVVNAGVQKGNVTMDAVGPERYTFEELVRLVARSVGSRALIVHAPPGLALLAAQVVGRMVRDVVLTPDEVKGLMANLLVSKDPPTGSIRLSDWLDLHNHLIGLHYASEVGRHYR